MAPQARRMQAMRQATLTEVFKAEGYTRGTSHYMIGIKLEKYQLLIMMEEEEPDLFPNHRQIIRKAARMSEQFFREHRTTKPEGR